MYKFQFGAWISHRNYQNWWLHFVVLSLNQMAVIPFKKCSVTHCLYGGRDTGDRRRPVKTEKWKLKNVSGHWRRSSSPPLQRQRHKQRHGQRRNRTIQRRRSSDNWSTHRLTRRLPWPHRCGIIVKYTPCFFDFWFIYSNSVQFHFICYILHTIIARINIFWHLLL